MSQLPDSPANYCYRHPTRQSFILCQRCGRTVCTECQTQAAVGVHCPECVREARQSMPNVRPAAVTAIRRTFRATDAPVVTYGIIALCLIVFVAEAATGLLTSNTGGPLYQQLAYVPQLTAIQPWRIVTTLFTHSSVLHLLFNMFSLFILGRQLEPMIGRVRFALLFLLSGVGGSVGVLLFLPDAAVVGASGAVFGMFGAYFVIARYLGANASQLIIVIAINLAIGFVVPGIAWQAHLGGLVVGAVIGLVYMRTRSRSQRTTQALLVAAVAVGILVLTIAGVTILAGQN